MDKPHLQTGTTTQPSRTPTASVMSPKGPMLIVSGMAHVSFDGVHLMGIPANDVKVAAFNSPCLYQDEA